MVGQVTLVYQAIRNSDGQNVQAFLVYWEMLSSSRKCWEGIKYYQQLTISQFSLLSSGSLFYCYKLAFTSFCYLADYWTCIKLCIKCYLKLSLNELFLKQCILSLIYSFIQAWNCLLHNNNLPLDRLTKGQAIRRLGSMSP